jgi:hypothetical protein
MGSRVDVAIGAIVPIARGQMRNQFYPSRIAEYVSQSEQRALLKNNVTIERDYTFAVEPKSNPSESPMMSLEEEPVAAPARPRGHEVEKLSVERSMELLEIFVPPRMDFYRQPILEDRAEESDPWENSSRQRTASSAASDLLAARAEAAAQKLKKADSIYGSVSTHDILVAVRASIARNDEAARVILAEDEITFMDEPARSEQKVKSIGDFTVELKPRGAATGLKRTVRVIPQDA